MWGAYECGGCIEKEQKGGHRSLLKNIPDIAGLFCIKNLAI